MKLLVQFKPYPTPEKVADIQRRLAESSHTTLRYAFQGPLAVSEAKDGVGGAEAEFTVEVGGYWPSDAAAEMKATFFKCGLTVTYWAVGTTL
ncbi:MAG: hypothetical protein HYT87_05505 [Nitrospirae bacterium]|nr:hypothetical protein [Nitrospirota bacterium]